MEDQPQPVALTPEQVTLQMVQAYATALARDVVTTHQGQLDLFAMFKAISVLTLEVDAMHELMLELAPDRVAAEARLHEHFRRVLALEIAKLERPAIVLSGLNGQGR